MKQPPGQDALYQQFARISKALASPKRLELVDLLAQGERAVEDLAAETAMSVANTSQHLQVLRAARLVDARRDGLYVVYRLADPQVFRFWQALRGLGESRLAEVQQIARSFLTDRSGLEPVSMKEFARLIRRPGVVVLDVRPASEYQQGHVPGARSVPLAELARCLEKIPKDAAIVAYCRGPYCVFADEAVNFLRAHGRSARRLAVGYPDWAAAQA